jgi:hypothetical protein
VQFGLKFEVQEPEAVAENENDGDKPAKPPVTGIVAPMAPPKVAGGLLKPTDKGRDHTGAEITQKPKGKKGDKAKADAAGTPPADQPTAAVVSLDAFRKKK